jgi:hypothetical protein
MSSDLTSFDQMMHDLFCEPGKEKQWVLDVRAARAELVRTGARRVVPEHDDNCGSSCRNVGPATLVADMADHDCCYFCTDAAEEK